MSNGDKLVPSEIVQLIFNQTKNAIDANTESIKTLSVAINELAKFAITNPGKKEILEKLEKITSFETIQIEKYGDILNSLHNTINICEHGKKELVDSIEKTHNEIMKVADKNSNLICDIQNILTAREFKINMIGDIEKRFEEFIRTLKIFAVIITTVLSITGAIHFWVDRNINRTIDIKFEKAIEKIITTRPSNIYTPSKEQSTVEKDKTTTLPIYRTYP
jgi:hypothetical protein